MAKYHINSKGVAAKCSAQHGNCPFGGESQHYDSLDTAKKEAEKQLAISHAILESLSSTAPEKGEIINTNIPTEEDREQFVDNVFNVFKQLHEESIEKDTDKYVELVDSLYDNLHLVKDGDEDWEKVELLVSKMAKSNGLDKNYADNVEKFIENMIPKHYGQSPFKNMEDYEKVENAEELFDRLQDMELQNINSEIIAGDIARRIENSDYEIDMRDIGKGFYAIHIARPTSRMGAGDYLMYAPDGFDTENIEIDFTLNTSSAMFADGSLGLDGIDKDGVRDMVDNGLLQIYKKPRVEEDGSEYDADEEYAGDYEENENRFTRSTMREKLYDSIERKEIPVDKGVMKSLAIAKNLSQGNTFLQRNYPEVSLKLSGDMKKDGAIFESGISIVDKTNDKVVENYKNSSLYNKSTKAIRERKLYDIQESYSIEDEKENAAALLEEEYAYEDYYDFITYSSERYSIYSARAHGYRKDESEIEDYHIAEFNKTLKDFNKNTAPRTRALFRGATTPRGITTEEYMKQFNIGDVTIPNKATSTTIDSNIVKSFGNTKRGGNSERITFIYHTKKGAYIAPISNFPVEEEVILPIGEQMVVVDKGRNENGEPFIVFSDNE